MTGLEAALTAAMVAQYGDGYLCTRDLSTDPMSLEAEQLPRLFLWETARSADEYSQAPYRYTIKVQVIGAAKGANSAAVQTALNTLESVIDDFLYPTSSSAVSVLNGIPVEINADGDDTIYVGDSSGVLDYPITVAYRRA
jgi:hypothetical protein